VLDPLRALDLAGHEAADQAGVFLKHERFHAATSTVDDGANRKNEFQHDQPRVAIAF
jgi:hypothetical protein